jgi:hypothetical protein
MAAPSDCLTVSSKATGKRVDVRRSIAARGWAPCKILMERPQCGIYSIPCSSHGALSPRCLDAAVAQLCAEGRDLEDGDARLSPLDRHINFKGRY